MRPLWIVASLLIAPASCGITDADRCSEGRVWSKQYQGCLDPPTDSSTGDAGDDAGTVGQPDSGTTELGATCSSDNDCKGATATTCLLDPTAPTSPGMCTIPNCTAADCGGTDFHCCDCTQSPVLSSLWTAPVCVPVANVATLSSIACTCE
jgi:hypothetical protein